MLDRIVGGLDKLPVNVRAMILLHRAGWSIGNVVARGRNGRPVWILSGSNGENLIRSEGTSSAEVWGRAVDQAGSLGMLGMLGSN